MPYTAFRWRDYADLNSGAAISFSGSLSQCAGYLKTWLQRSYSELQLRKLRRWLAFLHYRYDLWLVPWLILRFEATKKPINLKRT